MSSLDYLDLCRLCLVKDGVSVPIFEGETFLKISACLPVKVTREDKLPKKICHDCVCKVELFYDFCNTTANSEKQLLQLLGDVHMEDDKQNYIETVLSPNRMKSDEGGKNNRLEDTVMQQVSEHQNSMNIMDNIMDMPMMISGTTQQQITSVPMDTTGESVQNVPVAGPSTQMTHEQVHINQNQSDTPMQQEEEEESSEEEENFEEECDADEGLPVKEESEEDPNNRRTVEPTTFVNVSLTCEEAGPSGLQQQKIPDIPDTMVLPQTEDVDPKTGCATDQYSSRGIFIFDKESVVMKKWQILEFDGKPYYAFIPEEDGPLVDDEDAQMRTEDSYEEPESHIDADEEEHGKIPKMTKKEEFFKEEVPCNDSIEEKLEEIILNENYEGNAEEKPILLNGEATDENDDLYQLKVQGNNVIIEKVSKEEEHKTEDAPNDEGEVEYLEEGLMSTLGDDVTPAESVTKSIGSIGPFRCKLCPQTFDDLMSCKRHAACVHKRQKCVKENGNFQCAVCDFHTTRKSQLVAHLERNHDIWSRKRARLFPCTICGFTCRSKHSLQSHFVRKHTDKYEYQCTFCSKKFKVKGDLTNHVRFHHKEKPVKCDVCGKMCQNSSSLYVHQKWAHFKPKFECHVCKRRMVTQENLDQHMKTQHEKRDKIVCAVCGKTFTKKDSFKRHMVVHTGCKPHSCIICKKPFARRSQLRQHLLIHTGKRPFVCDICGKAFTQKPGLICHRKIHPGSHPPLPVMPIGDIVKEFTEGYTQENALGKEEKIDEEA